MAFVPNPDEEEGGGQAAQGGAMGIAPVTTSSAPGAGPQTQGAGAQASNQNPGQPFTNLQSYLTANAPQIEQMGQNIAGQFQNQYGQLQGQIQGGIQDFGKQVQGGYTAPNQDVVNQAFSNPVQFTQNPDNVKAFQSQLNNVYSGPQNFEGTSAYGNLNQSVTNAASKASILDTPAGFQSYLRGSRNDTTAGENLLDTVLLQGSPSALQNIQSATTPFKTLGGYLSGQVTEANQGVTAAQQAAQQSSQFANQGLTGAQTDFSTNVQNRFKTAQDAASLYNEDVGSLQGVASDYVRQIQNYLAQNPQLHSQLADLSPWANLQSINSPTAASASSPYDYQVLQALSQLGGDFNSPLNLADSAQAGTFGLPQDLQAAIASGTVPAAMAKELMGIQNQLSGAYEPYERASGMAYAKGTLPSELAGAQRQYDILKGGFAPDGSILPGMEGQINTAKANLDAVKAKIAEAEGKYGPMSGWQGWEYVGPVAQGLQWLPGAATGYNDLVSALNAKLQSLGGLNLPDMPPPDFSQPTADPKAANIAGTAVGAGVPSATGAGLLAGSAPTTASSLAASGAGSIAGQVPAAGLTGMQAVGPAALAAYGTANTVQNSLNMIQSPNSPESKNALRVLASSGFNIATLSFPPQILDSIGNALKSVIDNIGNFFKGLF